MYPSAIIIIAGDFNTRVGRFSTDEDTLAHPPLVGTKLKECDEYNRNGNELILFCQLNTLAIANSYYAYEDIGTGTWRNPNQQHIYEYALDHILIQQQYLIQIIVEGGVIDNIDLPTDHRATKMLLKINATTNQNIPTQRKRKRLLNNSLDFSKLYDTTKLMKSFKFHMNEAMDYKHLNTLLLHNQITVDEVVEKITMQTKLVTMQAKLVD